VQLSAGFAKCEPAHGIVELWRVEHRRLISSTLLNDHLDWPGVKQVCQIIRTTTRKGETTTEVASAMTSVGRDRANALALRNWNRGHWEIENRIHWVRDESFGVMFWLVNRP